MDHKLALDVLKDRRVARGVRDREVDVTLDAVGGRYGDHAELLLADLGDGLFDGCEVVEEVLGPRAGDDGGPRVFQGRVL